MEWNQTNRIKEAVTKIATQPANCLLCTKKNGQLRTGLSQSFVCNKMMLNLQSNFKVALRIYVCVSSLSTSLLSFFFFVAFKTRFFCCFLVSFVKVFFMVVSLLLMSFVIRVSVISVFICAELSCALLCYALSLLFNVCECVCVLFFLLFIVLTLSS